MKTCNLAFLGNDEEGHPHCVSTINEFLGDTGKRVGVC